VLPVFNSTTLLAAAGANPADPLGVEVWVFDADLTQVLLVLHPWRGLGTAGGKVEPGEREAARRELLEETGWEPSSRTASRRMRPFVPPQRDGDTRTVLRRDRRL
jgi:8-oxo-dGTP pyrophosphatase MutT (NUDIX family)